MLGGSVMPVHGVHAWEHVGGEDASLVAWLLSVLGRWHREG